MNQHDKFTNWRKSSLSNGGTDCVEVSESDNGTIGVRDSKLGDASAILEFTASEWLAFTKGVKAGEFD